jgi:hypothetical protein
MDSVVVIPGMMGSRLRIPGTGEEVWPPRVGEVIFGYDRIDKLVRPDLQAFSIIDRQCQDVYGSLLDALKEGIEESGGEVRLVPHPYDWRRDLTDLAEALATRLDTMAAETGGGIALICHSMGGLIARAVLEDPLKAQRPGVVAVNLAVFLAVPHEGAPLALARIVGIGGKSLGLSARDLRKISNLDGFPAAYQLLPHPPHAPVWDFDGAVPFAPVDVLDPGLADEHGLNRDSLGRLSALRALLDPARRPARCRYVSVASATHETLSRFDRDRGQLRPVLVKGAGDGTVPIQSAASLAVQTAYIRADHVALVQETLTHRLVLMLLGMLDEGAVAAAADAAAAAPLLSLSDEMMAEDEAWEIVVAVPVANPAEGKVSVERLEEAGSREVASIGFAIASNGAASLALAGPRLAAGSYRAVLELRDGRSASKPFIVSRAV